MNNNKFVKNKKQVLREFNKEKYFNIYNFFKKKKSVSIKDVDKFFCKNEIEYNRLEKEKKIMINYISKFAKKTKDIVDLGCGYGSKSFGLVSKKKFSKKNFFLLDFSSNGIKIIKLIIKCMKKDLPRIRYNISDFYNHKKVGIKIPKNSLIFTSYSLHYKRKLNDNFLKLMIKLKPKFVIHFEPVFEHILEKTKNNEKIKKYFLKNNYSLNLLSILKRYEKLKKIKIIFEKKQVFGVNKLLPFSVIIWKRIN